MLQETTQVTTISGNTVADVSMQSTEDIQRPFVSDEPASPELTLVSLITGIVLGLIFGAASLYLILKVGLTISASIPIAVISVTLFRALTVFGLRNRSILEHNIVQTAGSAGESIAFGIGVTTPALLLLGFDLELTRILLVAAIGGLLGVLLVIPLRRRFIVLGHRYLQYPEGRSCAEVLEAGSSINRRTWDDRATSPTSKESTVQFPERFNSKPLFIGVGVSALFHTMMSVLKLWKENPEFVFGPSFRGASISLENNTALLGVGYLIGPRVALTMAAGGTFSSLLLIPLIKYFGEGSALQLAPATVPIAEMTGSQIHRSYILFIGAGAIVAAGLINFLRSLPTILESIKNVQWGFGRQDLQLMEQRTNRDLPHWIIATGIILLIGLSVVSPQLNLTALTTVLLLLLAVMFVTISARLTGELGASLNPVSAMMVATLLIVCLLFLCVNWTTPFHYLAAFSIGAVVCIAASMGGTTSQVLKTGYLVGATPRNQQIAILLGALFSALVLSQVLVKLNDAGTVLVPRVTFEKINETKSLPVNQVMKLPPYTGKAQPPPGSLYRWLHIGSVTRRDLDPGNYLIDQSSGRIAYRIRENFRLDKAAISNSTPTRELHEPGAAATKTYYVVQNTDGSAEEGEYLADQQGNVAYLVDPGINGSYTKTAEGTEVEKFAAPKATLMAYFIKGILNRDFPWALVVIGIMIVVTMELAGVSSLPFAVGLYLPFSSSTPLLIGGVIRWLAHRKNSRQPEGVRDDTHGPGTLLSSGFIVGGAITGIFIALIAGFLGSFDSAMGKWAEEYNPLFSGPNSAIGSFAIFILLGLLLYLVARGVILSPRGSKVGSDNSGGKSKIDA